MRARTLLGIGMTLALVAGLAVAGATRSRAVPAKQPTLRFKLKTTAVYPNDVAPTGTSIGDQVTSSSEVRSGGAVVGHVGATCTFTGTQAICAAIIGLKRGALALSGRLLPEYLSGTGVARFAVTGGTGAYRYASGWATIERTGAQLQTLVVYLR